MGLILSSKPVQYWIISCAIALTFLSFLAFHALGNPSLGSIQHVLDLEDDDIHKLEAFELEGVSATTPFPEYPASLEGTARLSWLLDTLEPRLRLLTTSITRPACSLNLDRYAAILKSSRFDSRAAHPISIAINLRNSERVLAAQCDAILTALFHLMPKYKVYISIFENDSSDMTPFILGHFASALERLGVNGVWMTSSRMHSGMNVANRINMLSEFRNAALRPLLPVAGSGTVIFINDVILCASDILELVLQQQIQSADVAVGVDWADSSSEGPSPPYVYDAWVLRGINGQMVYRQSKTSPWPVSPPDGRDWITNAFCTQSTDIQERWLNNLPFPVYAGWGGIAALKASLFTEDGVRFRSSSYTGWTGGSASGSMGAWGKLVTDEQYMTSDCPGDSECGLIMRDIWNIRNGAARVVLAPSVNTAYDLHVWKAAQLYLPFVPRERAFELIELINWKEAPMPREVVCMPGMTADGKPHDAHDVNLFRYLTVDPFFQPAATAQAVS